MVPLAGVLAELWWVVPAAGTAVVATYTGLTTGKRRARRLAVDAARLEEQQAARRLIEAQADTRTAKAELAAAQAQSPHGIWDFVSTSEARRRLQQAKLAQRSAALSLKSVRGQVSAERARMGAITSLAEYPLVRLVRRHDAIVGRWLEYETDVASALAFPQMTNPRHPSTAAFLRAMQRASAARPASGSLRMPPADFIAYRRAVDELEAAFRAAEESALRASTRPHRAVD